MHDKSKSIRMAIASAGLSQSQLAARMGTSKSYVHRLCQDNPSVSEKQMKRIADACGVNFRMMMDWGWED